MSLPAHNPKLEDVYVIKDDAIDPVSGRPMPMQGYNMAGSAFARPDVRYRGPFGEFILTVDLYRMGDSVMAHLYCPRCRNALQITSDRKQMSWDPEKGFSCEPFECTWELSAERQDFGVNLCRWRVGITNNVARDA